MASPETRGLVKLVVGKMPLGLLTGDVLEIGSFDVNGSTRSEFESSRSYTGVDICEGPGVDVVAFGQDLSYPDESFDVGISISAFEHDPNFRKTFANLVRMTRRGGAVIVSCAGRGFPEHGTTRTGAALSPGTTSVGSEYYRNVTESDLLGAVDFDAEFEAWRFWYLKGTWDLFLVAYRRGVGEVGAIDAQFPTDREVYELERLTSWPHRLARLPLHILHYVLPESVYDRVAGRLWFRMFSFQNKVFGGRFTRLPHAD